MTTWLETSDLIDVKTFFNSSFQFQLLKTWPEFELSFSLDIPLSDDIIMNAVITGTANNFALVHL